MRPTSVVLPPENSNARPSARLLGADAGRVALLGAAGAGAAAVDGATAGVGLVGLAGAVAADVGDDLRLARVGRRSSEDGLRLPPRIGLPSPNANANGVTSRASAIALTEDPRAATGRRERLADTGVHLGGTSCRSFASEPVLPSPNRRSRPRLPVCRKSCDQRRAKIGHRPGTPAQRVRAVVVEVAGPSRRRCRRSCPTRGSRPGRASAATRAAMWTAMPPTSSPMSSHSPVCRPDAELEAERARRRRRSRARSAARGDGAPSNATRKRVADRLDHAAAEARRPRAGPRRHGRPAGRASAASPIRAAWPVASTMSVNRTVSSARCDAARGARR